MASLDVVAAGGKKAGSVELDPLVFEAPIKPHLFHAEVRRQLSRRRAGSHSTKNRAAVSGGGAKPYRQKGTGRARQGGGVVFGPVPRSYEQKLPKKVRRAALRAALSLRLREEAVTVVESFGLEEYSTKRMAGILSGLGLAEASLLVVLEARDPYVERSARNLPGVSVIRAEGLNVYDVLRHRRILFTRAAALAAQRRLGSAGEEVAS